MLRAIPSMIAVMVLCATSANAALPVPPVRIDAPRCIALVGSHAGVPDVLGRFAVTVRDFANNPMDNMPVVVDLSRCADLRLCSDPLDPAIVVDCAARTAVTHTNALGVATFTLLGSSLGYASGAPSSQGAQGRVFVPPFQDYGVAVTVTAYDLDGFAGLGANDLSMWLTDFGSGVPWARSDYDGGGSVGANDLSLWLEGFGHSWGGETCASRCP